ncbi:MAG: transposase [Phycisphaerae bacterium]
MVAALDATRRKHDLELWAYVVMPEHVHLLIYPTQKMYDISKILTTLKQPVAKKATLLVQREAPGFAGRMTDRQPNGKVSLRFWDRGGGYDRNLWSPAYVWETIDYIHHNPVRRGLCDSPVDWHGSSAVAYHSDEECPLALDLHSLPDDPRSAVR